MIDVFTFLRGPVLDIITHINVSHTHKKKKNKPDQTTNEAYNTSMIF